MPTAETDFRKLLDSVGIEVQKKLDSDDRSRKWLAGKLELSSVSLVAKMKDNDKFTEAELAKLGMVPPIGAIHEIFVNAEY